jgi:hypothetical protein
MKDNEQVWQAYRGEEDMTSINPTEAKSYPKRDTMRQKVKRSKDKK